MSASSRRTKPTSLSFRSSAKLAVALLTLTLLHPFGSPSVFAETAKPVDYARDVAPLWNKYCTGCHNDGDREGKLSLQSFAALQRGGESGAALTPGNAQASRLVRLIQAADGSKMPPNDNPGPTAAEMATIIQWIQQGAVGPNGEESVFALKTPHIVPAGKLAKPVTSMDWSSTGLLAVGSFGRVEIRPDDASHAVPLGQFPGKVTSVRFSHDGARLLTTSGATGLIGWAGWWDTRTGKLLKEFRGHHDLIHVGAISPNGKMLATGSYDKRIILWDVASGSRLRELTGHNGAVYDIDFSPDGNVLASASADETIKMWRVSDGQRLDTMSQPLKEQYTVRFSPDGKHIVAGGADNRIRVWRFVSRTQPQINPLIHARFAHEGAVSHLRFASGGKLLVSAAEDRSIKLWDTQNYTETHLYPLQSDVVGSMACSPDATDLRIATGRMDGATQFLSIPQRAFAANVAPAAPAPNSQQAALMPTGDPKQVAEQEPNNSPSESTMLTLPALVKGVIQGKDGAADDDYYRFRAKAGETWMVEVNAARQKSKLDSRIEVLHADGAPVQRVLLQAMRDSYFTFRGKDSDTSGDFRVHNWREMELNEHLYCNGEVVKLWHYPRGPDSGFIVYPGEGNRHTFFGTSPMAHALHEPCYIVQPLPVGADPVPNGLPVFPIYFENDDDPLRAWGADSRLEFTAPADGDYLVRIEDIRGEQGADYKYDLTVRRQRPNFKVTLKGADPTINAGSGKEFSLKATRDDGFSGEILVTIEGLPPGFQCSSPLTIQAHQDTAFSAVWAAADAKQPSDEQLKAIKVTATATIHGKTVERPVNSLGKIKLAAKPKILVRVVRAGQKMPEPASDAPIELTIAPGETITAEVVAQRFGYDGRISLGSHDAGRNLPHGVFVDNIGLNGLMIVDKQVRREFFITAAPFVPEQTRTFHLRTGEEGKQTTRPVLLHVKHKP